MTVLRESIDRTGKSLTEKKLNMKITSPSAMLSRRPRHVAALAGLALTASALLSGCSAGVSGTQTGSKTGSGGLSIAQGRVFKWLHKPKNFSKVQLEEYGHHVYWVDDKGSEIDLGADGLRRDAEKQAELHKLMAS